MKGWQPLKKILNWQALIANVILNKYITALFVCSCSFFLNNAAAQDIPHFMEKLTREDGLSSNKISDIVQDDNGFLWIATTDGLNRFDGTEVLQYFHKDNSNSISHNYIYCLAKLADNYIAIGTQAGLDFYNSNTGVFTNFYYKQNRPVDEFSNIIPRMAIDAKGNLWAASSSCIYVFDSQRRLKNVIPSGFSETDITRRRLKFIDKMLPLSNGDMLFYLSSGIKIYSSQEKKLVDLENSPWLHQLKFLYDLSKVRSFQKSDEYTPYANVFKIFDRYFLCLKPGIDSLFVFDEQGRSISNCYFAYNKYPYILWSQQISMIDSGRLLFLYHNYGLASIKITWQNNNPIIHSLSPLLFENYEYDAALSDRQGNWWLATTEHGLQKISPGKQYFTSDTLIDNLTGKPIGYEINFISKYDNTLWVSTYGNGFFEVDLRSGSYKQHVITIKPENRWTNFVWNVRQVTTDTLWVGTQAGMFWYCLSNQKSGRIPDYPGKPFGLDTFAITTQFPDSRGRVWIGLGRGNGVCCFDTKTRHFSNYPGNSPDGYPFRYPTIITEDTKGNLWFVNDASGSLAFLGRDDEHFRVVKLQTDSHKRVSNLSALFCKNDTTLWLGTITDGLVKYNVPSGSVTMYGHEKGLSNSHIGSIYEDNDKRVWLATEGDLSSFDERSETFINYSEKDGLPASYPTSSFYYDEKTKRLYTGGGAVLFYFDPGKMNAEQQPGETMITAMYVNADLLMPDPDKMERFGYWQNNITIQYSAIDLSNGPGTKYAYKLLGEDTGWVMAGHQRQINFSRLAPGHYTFIVRASNNNGRWSTRTASVRFYIKPPFTKTIWFYALILVGIAVLFYAMYRFRLRQLTNTEQVRSEISRNLHDEVGSTLTNISLGSLLAQKQMNDLKGLNKILKRIYEDSQHVSESMREIVWSINPKIDTLGESLPRMLHYASELLEAEDIELHAEIAPEIEKVKLSMQKRRDMYMIFKEAVNNLAKHSKAKRVNIQFSLTGKIFAMKVADDGIGFDTNTTHVNNGLKNMQERAQRHHWKIFIRSEKGKGTSIMLHAQIA